jgi:hypothetical protein
MPGTPQQTCCPALELLLQAWRSSWMGGRVSQLTWAAMTSSAACGVSLWGWSASSRHGTTHVSARFVCRRVQVFGMHVCACRRCRLFVEGAGWRSCG